MSATMINQEIIHEARRLSGLLADNAAEAEAQRRPPDAVIEALRDARIFDIYTPRAYGGLELDLDTFLEVILELAKGDASMAWLTGFYITHNWMWAHFPTEFQDEVFRDAPHALAPAAIAPSGVAEPAADGVRVSGRWSWGTGINHSPDWVIVGTHTANPDGGVPEIRLCAVPRAEVVVEDVWHTSGMRATGSHDLIIENVTLPSQQTLLASPLAEGVEHPEHDAPLYQVPMMPLLMFAIALPIVGQARAVVDRFAERIQGRILLGTKTRQASTSSAQMRLARAELELVQAERQIRATTQELMALRSRATVADRARLMAATALAVDQAKRVVQSVTEASGASAFFSKDHLQRALRDVEMMTNHPTLSLDGRVEMMGRLMLGLEPNGPV